ncbi:TPA: hypothetical protein RNS96_000294 [Stenotrophomonas maltophilia]|jgi:hypothetical protein|uniref:Uncharacterized protein n=1 Tax=Stenotrophomonas maltophilia TaxID=40324 RepID=A0AAI9FXH0_STEMA|nr:MULTISPECIES: hypothetical protein [Stenotrophomonas]EKT4439532.1 hypothetical protein [Stenotrophomonas maltophilia]MBB1135700.1 hypothetical protein [Stenotrophomonas sp. I18B00994]MBH1463643.1 hypothetical protein [Stenotrophomonas maltophilia]MBH1559726.1 hypothetical protein [Stenotrophomonas maltophilia]MBH1613827.1 hypothetical protein [Stenotrophomonas maltophilia]
MEQIINATTLKFTAVAIGVVLVGWLVCTLIGGLFNSVSSSSSMYDKADAAIAASKAR